MSKAEKKTTAPKKKHTGAAFNYKHLSVQSQVNGLHERAAQLEAEDMSQRIRKQELILIAEDDINLTPEMLSEALAACDTELARITKRLGLIEAMIESYGEEESEDV